MISFRWGDLILWPKKARQLRETDEGQLFRLVGVESKCPDCNGEGFYEGPHGGINVNVFCMNRECRSGFNLAYFDPSHGTCERIHKGDIRQYPKEGK